MNNENTATVVTVSTESPVVEGSAPKGKRVRKAKAEAAPKTPRVRTPRPEKAAKAPKAEKVAAAPKAPRVAKPKVEKAPRAEKAPKAEKVRQEYPFATKAMVAARIESEPGFIGTVMTTLFQRQTTFEQETSSTKTKNARGFMSSHAVNGSRIAKKLIAGEALDETDTEQMAAIAPCYTKQIAHHLREEAIRENPELAAKAAAYFTNGGL